MYTPFSIVKGLPLLAAIVTGLATYPAIPSDLTTPSQQRLAISGLNCKSSPVLTKDRVVLMWYSQRSQWDGTHIKNCRNLAWNTAQ